MINNAKMDVQRSKAALQQLYRMQRYQNSSGSPVPNPHNAYGISPWNPMESASTLIGSIQPSDTRGVMIQPPFSLDSLSPVMPRNQSQQLPLNGLSVQMQNSNG